MDLKNNMMIKNDKKIIQDITALAAAFLDVTPKQINSSNRRRDLVAGRMAISNFLIRDLGFKYDRIVKYINRDRTSFYYYEGKHDTEYIYWLEYRELYKKIKNSYLGVDNASMTKERMEEIILDAGIVSDLSSAFMVTFKIGNAEASVYVDGLEDTIAKLKRAFKSFNYSFGVEHKESWTYAE